MGVSNEEVNLKRKLDNQQTFGMEKSVSIEVSNKTPSLRNSPSKKSVERKARV